MEKIKNASFSQVVLYISLCCVGIFHDHLSCLLSVVLLVALIATAVVMKIVADQKSARGEAVNFLAVKVREQRNKY